MCTPVSACLPAPPHPTHQGELSEPIKAEETLWNLGGRQRGGRQGQAPLAGVAVPCTTVLVPARARHAHKTAQLCAALQARCCAHHTATLPPPARWLAAAASCRRAADGAVELTLTKGEGMHWWRCVLAGGPVIDVTAVEPESSKLDDLDAETRQTVEKMMVRVRARAGAGRG